MTPFPQPLADRYRRFKHRHFDANIYEELATYGQSPDVMVVSCCDSRVDPETIFSAMPGELFVMRNVANLIPPYETGGTYHGVSAAIEFAVLNLRIKHLLIMGHAGCGGVKAALDREVRETDSQFITKWMAMLDTARLAVLSSHQGASHKDMITALEHEGIKTSLKNLRTFPFLAERENNGKLALHGAYFDIGTGNLSVLNESTGQFYAL